MVEISAAVAIANRLEEFHGSAWLAFQAHASYEESAIARDAGPAPYSRDVQAELLRRAGKGGTCNG